VVKMDTSPNPFSRRSKQSTGALGFVVMLMIIGGIGVQSTTSVDDSTSGNDGGDDGSGDGGDGGNGGNGGMDNTCSDEIDNDGDGLSDILDPECDPAHPLFDGSENGDA
jgi:hypothetical protein